MISTLLLITIFGRNMQKILMNFCVYQPIIYAMEKVIIVIIMDAEMGVLPEVL
jgi:hypothetical protein